MAVSSDADAKTRERRERFERLFDAHGDAVLRYALRRIDEAEVGDVLSETFLVAWRRLDSVPADARPWLLAVARRVLANQHRGRRRRLALLRRLAAEPRPRTNEADDPSGVRAALGRLSPQDREALVLVHWDGLSPGAAATVMGISALAFRSRLHRARRRLADELGGEPADLPERGEAYARVGS